MSSALSNSGDLNDLQRAVDRANDAVRAYVAEVEGERRRSGGAASGAPQGWTDRQSTTLAHLQGAYLAAYQALRAATRGLGAAA
ncbi:hypothetical protein [Peterkaempfera bronchialis]|uniref:Uncharacterized protein n=1 Tax=Peterkaempfera bronchialis TaxID=2126346 RepID=A0A345SSP4_9ACTN|nr:hypothetical protein [Peterkaempfera bronchialis]AXI76749.1 hypothetical protein C7M71_004030 [Peterkaempfera bronchialis]